MPENKTAAPRDRAWGVIIVDATRTVLAMDRAAMRLLAGEGGLELHGGRLCAANEREHARLGRLVAAVSAGNDATARLTSVSGPETTCWLTSLRVRAPIAVGSVAAVILAAADRSAAAAVCKRYRLTPAETRLAIELASGHTLKEAAARRGIRLNTARAHLRTIFDKTGATRQAALVRLLLVGK